MFTRAMLVLSLLIVSILPSPARAQAPDVCQPGARHTVFLPLVARGDIVPKSELLRRIDEAAYGASLTDADVYDESETSVPEAPSGISLHAMTDGILILVDFNVDRSHLHSRFRNFNAWARQFGSEVEDDSAMLIGVFSDNDFLWAPPGEGGFVGWEVCLSAVTNTEMESDKSSWQRIFVSTHYDDFANYGGDTITDVESLYWLQIAEVEPSEDWDFGAGGGFSTNYVVQGAYSGRCYNAGGGMVETVADATLEKSMDLSIDSRFGDDDYLCLPVYVAVSFSSLDVYFIEDEGLVKYFYKSFASPTTGWHYYQIKKSDFTNVNSADWANITKIQIIGQDTPMGPVDFYFDGWRIVKSDPDNGDEANPTGRIWNFSGGTWAVFPGMRAAEPFYNFSLAQIENDGADDYFATLPGVEMPANKISVGMMQPGGGRRGVRFLP